MPILPSASWFQHCEFMERIEYVWFLVLVFLHKVIESLAYCINTCFHLMTNYLRNILCCFLNRLKVFTILIRVQEITFGKVTTRSIVGIEDTTYRLFFHKIDLDTWEFLFDDLSQSFLLAPRCFLVNGQDISIKKVISYLTTATILFPISAKFMYQVP